MEKWLNKERLRHAVFGGLSVFTIKFIAEQYGLDKADRYVAEVYKQAEEEYGGMFETKKHPTYTEFKPVFKTFKNVQGWA